MVTVLLTYRVMEIIDFGVGDTQTNMVLGVTEYIITDKINLGGERGAHRRTWNLGVTDVQNYRITDRLNP